MLHHTRQHTHTHLSTHTHTLVNTHTYTHSYLDRENSDVPESFKLLPEGRFPQKKVSWTPTAGKDERLEGYQACFIASDMYGMSQGRRCYTVRVRKCKYVRFCPLCVCVCVHSVLRAVCGACTLVVPSAGGRAMPRLHIE